MNDAYTTLDVFEYSTEAQLVKTKLDDEQIRSMLMDESTVDSDPLISQAIGGVKLLVLNEDLNKAVKVYNDFRTYKTDELGNDINCPSCNSTKILAAPAQRKNIFYMLFPFFEKTRDICIDCKTIF